jgi:hypothetical protein
MEVLDENNDESNKEINNEDSKEKSSLGYTSEQKNLLKELLKD